jgi:hypothetical protein
MSFQFSLSVYKTYLFWRNIRHYVFSRYSLPVTAVICVLLSEVVTDVVVVLLS